jgi:hypothetical protein
MINGASQIIGNVPGKHLDPFLLVHSQIPESVGYVLVVYQRSGQEDAPSSSRFFDLLFFRGSSIFECVRMNRHIRFSLAPERIRETFRNSGKDESCRISLFLTTETLVQRFQSTIYCEPCLKIPVRAVSAKRISTLLQDTGCRRGIIECNDFTQQSPLLELNEVTSADMTQYRPKYKNGHILLYDTDSNVELMNERYGDSFSRSSRSDLGFTGPQYPTSKPMVHIIDSNADRDIGKLEAPAGSETADEFTQLIKSILDSPSVPDARPDPNPTHDEDVPPATDTDSESKPARRNGDLNSSRKTSGHKSKRKKIPAGRPRKPPSQRPQTKSPEPPVKQVGDISSNHQNATESAGDTQPDTPATVSVQEVAVAEASGFVRLYQRLFRSFRQQVFECYGDRNESVITKAEKKINFLTPEFDLGSLNDETAVIVLDLVEAIVDDAPFFKRSKLRTAALTLVADLYNKQYDVLEQHGVIDKVEQFYYRLKR